MTNIKRYTLIHPGETMEELFLRNMLDIVTENDWDDEDLVEWVERAKERLATLERQ